MAYKILNIYKESHILDLNLIGIHQYKRTRVSPAEILLTCVPLVAFCAIFAATVMPEMNFMAECMNVKGGDICNITLK